MRWWAACGVASILLIAACDSSSDTFVAEPPPEQMLPTPAVTNSCAGQPGLTGARTNTVLDAFPGDRRDFIRSFLGIGDCETPGDWLVDSVVCFVPEFDCSFDVEVDPRDLDTVAVMVAGGSTCRTTMPTVGITDCLGANVGAAPGDEVQLNGVVADGRSLVCVVARSAEEVAGSIVYELRGLDDCGTLR